MKNKIFEVDIEGLRQLQASKPKWIIIRELLQNAMDEDVTDIKIYLDYKYGKMKLIITDDSPEGFRDLADMYTLFKDTYKRTDVKKRGRFNFGEKQVLVLADYAKITSTKGGFEFDMLKGTKKALKVKRAKGSAVRLTVRMSKTEFMECERYCYKIFPPKDIKITVRSGNEQSFPFELLYVKPDIVFSALLLTELKVGDVMKRVSKETDVFLYKRLAGDAFYLCEMGIPICEIDCDYSIDVQQKVPLSNDRDMVDAKYLKTLYGEVLNQVTEEINKDVCSNVWVREGFTSPRATKETRQHVINERFGEKALIANPMDKRSMDEAITNDYNVVYGAEMNKEEWDVIRNNELMESTSAKFRVNLVDGKLVTPDNNQRTVARFCQKVATEMLGIEILDVFFYVSPNATVKADFSDNNILRFNIARIPATYWSTSNSMNRVCQSMLN